MADEQVAPLEDVSVDQIGKIVVAGVVFGMVIKNAVEAGLLQELKNFKLATLMTGTIQIVPQIVNALKGNAAVAALETAGHEAQA